MVLNKYHIGHRVLWLLMALHILNFSIDNPHTLFENSSVDADFDEIDSVVELVLEDIMHIEDAIPEHHTKTPITHKFNIKKAVWVFEQHITFQIEKVAQVNFKVVLPDTFYKSPLYNSPKLALFSPPPEV